MFYFLNIFSANKVATLCSVAPLYYVSVLQRLFRWPKATNTFLESRMFASPALCHSRKIQTQCLSGRTENNHGTMVSEQAWNTGLSECCTQNHGIATCQPHTHLRNGILFDTSRAGLFAHYAFTPLPPSYSKCTLLPLIPPPTTVHSITSRAAWVLQHCLGPHEGCSESFGCGQQIKASLTSGSA